MPPLDIPETSAAAVEGVAPTLLERVQGFVGEHKKAIVIAAAAAAVAGGVYYASTSFSKPPGDSASETSGKKKKKTGSRGAKKNGKDKEKRVGDVDGPILEERKPSVSTVEDGGECSLHAKEPILGC